MSYDYSKFNTGSGWQFKRTRETYDVTENGNYKRRPDKIETEIVSGDFYIRFIQSIPWFNCPHFCESCRATWSYTPAGYIPTRIVTSKKATRKYVDIFEPIQ